MQIKFKWPDRTNLVWPTIDRRGAGRVCTLWFDTLAVHVWPQDWFLGYESGWHDGPLHSFGLGPVLFCWTENDAKD